MANRTCIKLKTVDQRLTVVQQPILASGDVGMVRVEYELDSYWDGLTHCGTFYNGKTPEDVYEQPLADGACIIPWEVLTEDGVLYIGLRGVGEDGRIKTAAPVRYRMEKGSPRGVNTSVEPSPDVYQQILTVAGEAERAADEAERLAQSVRDDADAGLFNGAVKVAEDVFIIMTENVAHRSVQITRKNPLAVAVPVITLARRTNDTSDTNRNDLAVPLEVHGDYLHAYNVEGKDIVVRVDVYELGVAAEGGGSGAPGADGRGISSAAINTAGELVLTYTDGAQANVGKVVGADGATGPTGPQGPKGDTGAAGVGITSVAQTTTSTADGGSNVVTITLSDGTVEKVTIKNGSKGSTGATGATGPAGNDGAAGATFTPAVSLTGDISWTNDKGLPNPETVNIKGPRGTSVTITDVSTSDESGGTNSVLFSDGTWLDVKNGKDGAAGATGATGPAGKDGASITVTNVSTSTADGGSNVVTFSDGKTLTVKNGSKGSKGDTGGAGPAGPTGAAGADGNAIYYASVEPTEDPDGWMINKSAIETAGRTVQEGDLVITPSGVLWQYGEHAHGGDPNFGLLTHLASIKGSKGDTGPAYTLTSSDKTAIANSVKSSLPTLTMVGKDEDGVSHTWTIYGS